MAGWSLTVAALRHRPRQAVLVVALAALVGASAVLGPLYARAVEQSVLRTVVADAAVSDRVLRVSASGPEAPSAEVLAEAAESVAPAAFAPGVVGASTAVLFEAADRGYRARLVSRDGLCAHLSVTSGECVGQPNAVLLSDRASEQTGVSLGERLTVSAEVAGGRGEARMQLVVVGTYAAIDVSEDFWAGRGGKARAPARASAQEDRRNAGGDPPATTVDDLLTTRSTIESTPWPSLETTVDLPVAPDRVDLTSQAQLAAATMAVDEAVQPLGGAARSNLADVLDRSAAQRDQARTVVPVLAVQLALLGVVVLAFVCAAATEQRRPELALARLRGRGTRGAFGQLFAELGTLILLGTMLGGALGWGMARLAVSLWLEEGVRLEARLPVVVALAAAVVAGFLALATAAAPTLRQPVTTLLRRVPPRASAVRVGLAEGAIATATAAGFVTLLAGEGGPVALLAPGLLAVAGGLLLAQAAAPIASPASQALMRRGRLATGLAGLQITRRPALRRLVAILTVACALLVFAVDAWTVSARNRAARADFSAGAATVLTVDAPTAETLREAAAGLDVDRRDATPVVVTRSATETGPVTLAVDPTGFRAVANWSDATGRPTPAQAALLTPPRVPALALDDERSLVVQVDATFESTKLPRPDGLEGELRDIRLALLVDGADTFAGYVDLGILRQGAQTFSTPLNCPQRCRLRSVVVEREFGDSYPVSFTLAVDSIRVGSAGGGPPAERLDLGPSRPETWQLVPTGAPSPDAGITPPGPGRPLVVRDEASFQSLVVQRGDVPVVLPALGTGPLPEAFRDTPEVDRRRVVAPDLSGTDRTYELVGRFRGLPGGYPRAVLSDLGSTPGASLPAGAQTTYQMWLGSDDPALERQVRRGLAAAGITVIARDGAALQRQQLADEGAALALRLALLAGLVAVALAATVLVVGVATSGAVRARDFAGLRVVGVPGDVVRAAAVREQLVITVLGVVAGTTLGVVAASAALPQVPLFSEGSSVLPPDLSPAWWPVVGTGLGCLVLLGVVAILSGRAVAASAVPARLRGEQ